MGSPIAAVQQFSGNCRLQACITFPTVASLPLRLVSEVRKEFFEGARRARVPGDGAKGKEARVARVCYVLDLQGGREGQTLVGPVGV